MRTYTYQHRHNCSYANQTVTIDIEEQDGYFIPPNHPRCVERPEEELVRIQRLVEEDEDASNDEPADEEAAV